MSQARSARADGGAAHRPSVALKAADGLAFAAAPTFALMALLTGVADDHSAAHASPLKGMATMYLLMTAFHAAPWLKLLRAGGRSA